MQLREMVGSNPAEIWALLVLPFSQLCVLVCPSLKHDIKTSSLVSTWNGDGWGIMGAACMGLNLNVT